MKKLFCLCCLFFLFPTWSLSEWKFLEERKHQGVWAKIYINTSNIKIENEFIYLLTLMNFDKPIQKMFSSTEYVKIDCKNRRFQSLQLIFHEKHNGKGEYYRLSDDLTWNYPLPDSFIDRIRRNSCD